MKLKIGQMWLWACSIESVWEIAVQILKPYLFFSVIPYQMSHVRVHEAAQSKIRSRERSFCYLFFKLEPKTQHICDADILSISLKMNEKEGKTNSQFIRPILLVIHPRHQAKIWPRERSLEFRWSDEAFDAVWGLAGPEICGWHRKGDAGDD